MILHKQQIVAVTCTQGQELHLQVFIPFEVNDTYFYIWYIYICIYIYIHLYSVCTYIHLNVLGKDLVFA